MTEHDSIIRLFYLLYFHKYIYKGYNGESTTMNNNIVFALNFAVGQMGLYDEWCEYEERRRSDEQAI